MYIGVDCKKENISTSFNIYERKKMKHIAYITMIFKILISNFAQETNSKHNGTSQHQSNSWLQLMGKFRYYQCMCYTAQLREENHMF